MSLYGQLVRLTDRRRFKIGVVVGSDREGKRIRVCVWAQESGRWSQPQIVRAAQLELVPAWPAPDVSDRRRRTIVDAARSIQHAGGEIRYKGGAHAGVDVPALLRRVEVTP